VSPEGTGGGPPVLLTSLSSAALLDGRGDLSLPREMRGALVDWGGVIGQCVRLTGPWKIRLRAGGREASLPDTLVSAERTSSGWVGRHRWVGYDLLQRVSAVGDVPGVVRTLEVRRTEGSPSGIVIESSFAPYLLPVLVEGLRPSFFQLETGADALRVRQRGFGLAIRSNLAPSELALNGTPWIGGKLRTRVDELAVAYTFEVPTNRPVEWRCLVHGGLDRDLDTSEAAARAIVADPSAAIGSVAAADAHWLASAPVLRFPDAPHLERAYASACAALRRLYCSPGDGLTGLVAGYPWYSALWGRDLAWMLWAVLWVGDFEWANRSIDSVLRFQSRSSVPILGGEVGELAMQVSPGPIFFYGTSDTTLYYPLLIDGLLRHEGRPAPTPERLRAVRSMIDWGRARTDPATGLLRNGGEAEEISAATAALARVRAGINSPDTTIWDSTDRRDYAIDIQVNWCRALRAAVDLVGRSPDGAPESWSALADRAAASLRSRYVWASEEYLYDSLRGGAPVPQLRPNALRAVSAGLLPLETARRVVRRAARDDLTTAWGLRTLSNRDPRYDPLAYHDGQVWTIATAWAADAALAVGEADLGLGYLGTIASRYLAEGGWANECYRGDQDAPFDSCFLLGFSVAPFVTVLFERLWGLWVDARLPLLRVRPSFPASWSSASIDRLRFGTGTVDLDWSRSRLRVVWNGPGELPVDIGAGPVPVRPSVPVDLAWPAPGDGPRGPSQS
jgi:glycogen debranching enzyme